MCSHPVLHQPKYTKPFFLSTDASLYGVGAVLSQEGDVNPRTKKPRQHPIAYFSQTLPELNLEKLDDKGTRNGDIFERELYAVVAALRNWRSHLAGTFLPVTVLTDHANLTYWKEPPKVSRKVARWFAELQDYNIRIQHVPGKIHAAADMLSRPPGVDKGDRDNEDVTMLPSALFIRVATGPDLEQTEADALQMTRVAQERHLTTMRQWEKDFKLERRADTTISPYD
jgi:hypothetical protein